MGLRRRVVGLTVAAALVAAGGACSATKSVSPGKPPSAAQQAVTAQVEAFYRAYLAQVGAPTPAPVSTYVDQGFLTQEAATEAEAPTDSDLFTCSQNPLPYDKYVFSAPDVSGTTATMTVTGTYASARVSFVLGLTETGSRWAINTVTCPTP